ncbi:proline dehydrogenase family protein [Halorubraceae archaeon YAN]|nr:proline dehydrogenase family protein [Halorubraceae archaeon YAN]
MIPPIANRFVAGESVPAAVAHTKSMNTNGVHVILNLLGEHYDITGEAKEDVDTYLELITQITAENLDASVSVKPSQIGLDISDELFVENYQKIVAHAYEHDAFVWCDMEDATTTDITIQAFCETAKAHPWTVGQCFQSNLKRTADDLADVIDVPGKIRIVKGAYNESSTIAYTDKSAVNDAYRRDIEYLFSNRSHGVAIGSHDPEMIALAQSLASEHETEYGIQMLMGVRESAQLELAQDGVTISQYAPYGDKWFSYFYRRVRERKENALFALRAIVRS